jgi:hypothetical protein
LLRLRHHLDITRRGQTRQLMAEETVTLAVSGRTQPVWLADDNAPRLLDARPNANLSPDAATHELRLALDFLAAQRETLDAIAARRAEALLADHRRVRQAARDVGQYSVRPNLPVDVLGVYVLLPDAI